MPTQDLYLSTIGYTHVIYICMYVYKTSDDLGTWV
jgi:hypothetical protein